MNKYDKYLSVCHKLRQRYTDATGTLVISIGGKYSKYAIYEDLAAIKYLGCSPTKVMRK